VRDYAIFKLDPDGTVATWNAGAERIKGYRADEIVGQHFSRFYPEEDVRAGKCEMELSEATREGRFEDEGWRLRKDGTRFWANVVITALRGTDGKLVGFAKVTRDLTERRKLEQERLRRAHAEEAIRLREEFLAMVSHELNTPLTGLQLQLQHLMRRVDFGDEKTALMLRRAVDSGEKLSALVELLLDVTRIAQDDFQIAPQELDLAEVVAGVVEGLREQAQRSHSPMSVRSEGSTTGRWDRLRLEQLVGSLLSNALKYGAGAPIVICLSGDPDQVTIEVRDRGPGIAPEHREGLFERFARRGSIRNHGGLGLGLYLVREIARVHGGEAEARNAPEGGALFAVRLPRWGAKERGE
jgi:PAS domain S-box-containing protein